MKNKIIFYALFAVISALIAPITKFILAKNSCEKELEIYKEQENTTKQIIKTNNIQLNVIKKKLVANSNRKYREQLLAQIFAN